MLIVTAKGKGMLILSEEVKLLTFSEGYRMYSAMRELALRRRMDD